MKRISLLDGKYEVFFTPMPKVPRLSREMVVTEKIDGTNASVWITPSDVERLGHDPEVLATAVDEADPRNVL